MPDLKVRGRPFAKGLSGNPGGRPKGDGEIRELARQHTAAALQTLIEIAEGGENESARVSAANAILDRGGGKSAVPVVGADLPQVITFNFGTTLKPLQRDNDSGDPMFPDRTAIEDEGNLRRLAAIPSSNPAQR